MNRGPSSEGGGGTRAGGRGGVDHRVRRRQRARNVLQGLLLVAGMVVALAVVAGLVLGPRALVWTLVLGVPLLLTRPRVPTAWVLSMYGARPLPHAAAPELHRMVAVLSERAGLRTAPELHYVATPMPNAFVVGRADDAALAVTDGLLRHLNARQVAGVLAHEVAHLRAGDSRVMSLSDAVSRLVHLFSYMGLFTLMFTVPLTLRGDVRPLIASVVLVALPTVTTMLQAGLSRSREYDADLEAAALTGDPEGLASALEVLESLEGRVWERLMVPHGRRPDPLVPRTHPSSSDRARRLRELTPDDARRPASPLGHGQMISPQGYGPVSRPTRLRPPGIRW